MSATAPVSAATSPLVSPWQAPWYATPAHATPQHAMVLGAGIAGAAVAFSLARRGIRVTVFERGATVAGGASGLCGQRGAPDARCQNRRYSGSARADVRFNA